MILTALAAGMEEDEDDEVLEAGFSEGIDGSGLAVMFQRNIFADDPWVGDPSDEDVFNNTYCITLGSGETHFGGIRKVRFSEKSVHFTFTPSAAEVLQLNENLEVELNVSDAEYEVFRTGLRRVLNWGLPREIPEMVGF